MLTRLLALLSTLFLVACADAPAASNATFFDSQCSGFGYSQGDAGFANCTHMLAALAGRT